MNVADLFASLRIAPNTASFAAADRLIDGVKSALVALSAYAGANALKGMVESTVELGGHINDLSQTVGVSTDTLQELGYAAKLNSSDMDAMGRSLNKLQINMAKAKEGSKEQTKAFKDLGVTITDASGKLRPVEDVFEDISINQAAMTDGAKKLDAGNTVMGRGFKDLIPTMNDLAAKGFGNVIKEAHELGAVITSEGIAALDEFGDTQDKVKTALQGLKNEAVVALLPTIQKLADSFLEWVKANREMIKLKLSVVLNLLVKALQGVAMAADVALTAFEFLQKHWDIIKVSLLGLGAAMTLFKVKSIAAAVASGAAWAAANLPIVLLAALMTGLILLVDDVITAFQGGDSVLYDFFTQRFGVDLVDTLTRVVGGIKAAYMALVDDLSKRIEQVINAAKEAADFIYDLAHPEEVGRPKVGVVVNEMIADAKYQASQAEWNSPNQQAIRRDVLMRLAPKPSDLVGQPLESMLPERLMASMFPNGTTTIKAPVTVNISGVSGDAKEIGKAITDAIDHHWEQQIVQASSGVGGVK